jgi:hypothetical protein
MIQNKILNVVFLILVVVLTVLITIAVIKFTSGEKKSAIEQIAQVINVDPEEYFTDIANNATGGKLKEGFVKMVDFIFYGDKINNITFDSLKEDAKLRILKLAYKIDSKIDSIFPGYKETIKKVATKIYTNIKERLTKLYISITNKICTSNPSLCENAKEDFAGLKESFGLTFDFLKDVFNSGKESIGDWYLEYKESN